MLSIITAVYNQLEVSRLFLEHLNRHTRSPFELIIIDNGSSDGSVGFFQAAGARIIRNPRNYSYPYCQNQGLQSARFDVFAFLNNDVIVPPAWDEHLLDVMRHNHLEVVTGCGVERLENKLATRYYRKKWSLIRNALRLCGCSAPILRLMHRVMYGNWERFSSARWTKYRHQVREGFVGSSVVMNRRAVDKIGPWDERIQAGDFDLYLRTKARSLERGDIRPVHVALGVFIHHFIRMTFRSACPGFADAANLIPLRQKWGGATAYLRALD